jgi:CMP-N-acetylneuraminic acid synthetase/spore coat polysaccharide biosynthesis predicted glycosyltransferase SpsG
MKILAIIPARGGSKGIPRKNLRLLGDKPLIYYAINNAKNSKYITDVYVSSEDDEILSVAKRFGAKLHKRDKSLSKDTTTLDPVIYEAYKYAKIENNQEYDLIITLQPTSPLLKVESLDAAIEMMIKNKYIDTIISAKDDTHLSWKKLNGKYIPNYERRVNRQYLTPIFTETGSFLITRNNVITPQNRIGKNIDLYILKSPECIDIDTYEDWNLCEYYLKRKNILIVVRGNEEVGLGHVYNMLGIANDILNHNILFLALRDSKLAYDKIKEYNYPVKIQKRELIDEILSYKPDVVINDILDTDGNYIKQLKQNNIKVINFEDLGEGAKYADLVINAIYPEKEKLQNHFFGPEYFILRDEFIYAPIKRINSKVKKVLITFGGVDPNDYTLKVLESIYEFCNEHFIEIEVILGFGYKNVENLLKFRNIKITRNVKNMADKMLEADIIFTSAGRTIYEIASIGTPSIVLAQNERELTHFFASKENGFINLGLGVLLSKEKILSTFKELVFDFDKRKDMNIKMLKKDLKHGRKKVRKLINNKLEE